MALEKKNEYQIKDDDFQLVQSNQKIFDKALDTKPTTYAKDAFKRFCKNKSSIVGALIIGILVLLAIFVPVISTYNIDDKNPSTPEKLMPPKLFKAGTGFWDGVVRRTKWVYDIETKLPVETNPDAITNLVAYEQPEYVNTATNGGHGGYIMFDNTGVSKDATDVYLYSQRLTVTADNDYKITFNLKDENNLLNGELTEYTVYLTDMTNKVINQGVTITSLNKEIELKAKSKDYGTITIDVSKALKDKGLDQFEGHIAFVIDKKPLDSNQKNGYILIENFLIEASNINEEQQNVLDTISFDDANKMALIGYEKDILNGYWACNSRKGIYQAKVYYCDYDYDKYTDVYGLKEITISKSTLDGYVEKGWFKYSNPTWDIIYETDENGKLVEKVTNFKMDYEILDELCPIATIDPESFTIDNVNPVTGKLKDLDCNVYKYRDYGYNKMPVFIFGTTEQGFDLWTKAFAGLRTSLILGVCTAAFCFIFGLCWGAISGYFGGSVDLFMERFCELLSGVPTTVVLTLAILHLGNNFGTFVMALCLTGWMGTAGRTRTQFYRFKGREYVLASRTLGSSDLRLIFKHVLPNSMGTIVTGSVLMITSVIFSEASIAYLGLGLQGVNSFGVMMSNNQKFLGTAPNLVLFPSAIISLLMISFNLFGNGLRDALNPTLKGSE